jgi:hypothetical protein
MSLMTGPIAFVAGVAAATLIAAAPAAALVAPGHGGSLDRGGLTERQLRAFETQVLGPEHAAEHARERASFRASGLSPTSSAPVRAEAAAPNPQVGGRWISHFAIPVIGINAVMLPTGRVLWFAYPKNPNRRYGDPNAPNEAQGFLWDPAKGMGPDAFKRVDPPIDSDTGRPANIWCAGQALLPDGRVVVAGGNLAYATDTNSSFLGLNKIFTFNPWSETWKEQPHMENGRWYPTTTLMPDGRVLIIGGLDQNGHSAYSPNLSLEIFQPSSNLDGSDGTVTKLGMRGDTAHGQPPDGGLYPHLFWMKSGRVFVAGPNKSDSWFLHDPIGSSWGGSLVGHWDDIPDPARRRVWGSGVLLPGTPAAPATKVEQIGGSDPIQSPGKATTNGQATSTTEIYDESKSNPWQAGASMQVARSHLNTVLLPDSSMVTVGGGIGVVSEGNPPADNQWAVAGNEKQVDLFSPLTNTWHLGAAQAEARAYHSTALLMPDGRVVSAGDDYNGAGGPGTGLSSDTAEVYEPPYLFNASGGQATRPTITDAPSFVAWGNTFHVSTPDTNIVKAALVAPGATTHANDMSQRVVPVAIQQEAGGVRLTAPLNPDVALPGYYMLFLINAQGVPSVSRWISLSWTPVPARTPPVWPKAPKGGVGLPGKPGTGTVLGGRVTPRGPTISFARSGLNARRGLLSGRVSDTDGVKTVQVALALKGRHCRWWSRKRGRLSRVSSCKRPAWIKAKLRKSGNSFVWKVSLRGRVRRGHYIVELRAVDGKGNVTTRAGGSAVHISVRR